MLRGLLLCSGLLTMGNAMSAVDVLALWDFNRPEVSEQRFRERLMGADANDTAILTTQIARSHGLRRNFEEARRLLAPLAEGLGARSVEAQVRYHLELGRTWVSATHRAKDITAQARDTARAAYQRAHHLAQGAGLEYLAIDALHMLPFVETEPAQVLAANQACLAAVLASRDPNARAWEGSLRNNTGYTLHQLGRYEEALAMFRSNVALSEQAGNPSRLRIAHWMVAWTLRALNRWDDALAIQTRLEAENAAAGTPDEYVFEELAHLQLAKGDEARAAHYRSLLAAVRKPAQ
jgi:tetratricopeptide (TPR) repeat protein